MLTVVNMCAILQLMNDEGGWPSWDGGKILMRRNLLIFICCPLLLIFAAGSANAQSGTSSALAGTVTDSSGSVVAGAKISALDVDRKADRKGLSDASGRFLFSQINPGNYRVTVEATGFAMQTSQALPVGV